LRKWSGNVAWLKQEHAQKTLREEQKRPSNDEKKTRCDVK
jgi:hypothetical protein